MKELLCSRHQRFMWNEILIFRKPYQNVTFLSVCMLPFKYWRVWRTSGVVIAFSTQYIWNMRVKNGQILVQMKFIGQRHEVKKCLAYFCFRQGCLCDAPLKGVERLLERLALGAHRTVVFTKLDTFSVKLDTAKAHQNTVSPKQNTISVKLDIFSETAYSFDNTTSLFLWSLFYVVSENEH